MPIDPGSLFVSRVRPFLRKLTRRRLQRTWSAVLFACMSIGLMGNSGCEGCALAGPYDGIPQQVLIFLGNLFGISDVQKPIGPQPKIVGTDGSQTGLAAFLGNFSSIAQPSQNYFLVTRQPDCSLFQVTATTNSTGGATNVSSTTNYERTLHQLAQLSTTADVFANGCVETSLGITSRAGVFAGVTTGGIAVMATAAGNGNNNAVFVLTTNSSLSPYHFTPLPALTAASALATGDFNGDKNGDLVVVNGYNAASSYISVLLGNPDGSFQAPVNYPIAGAMSVAAVIDDINGDGKLDIVAASNDQHLSVLLGNGDGTFQAAQSFSVSVSGTQLSSLITADLRGTGKKDIICSNGAVLLGNGDGTFAALSTAAFPATQNISSTAPLGMASGDLNRDGKADLVIGTGLAISTWIGKGDGTFTQGISYPSISNSGYVTVTDLDGDGNLDIYSGLANGGLFSGDDSSLNAAYVLMGNGDGTFQGAGSTSLSYTGNNLGDVNGDGQPDLIGTNPNAQSGFTGVFIVGLGTPKGAFKPVSTITPPASFTLGGSTITGANTAGPTTFAVGDVTGDGKADLVFQMAGLTSTNPVTGQAMVYPNPVYFTSISNGDGTFTAPVPQIVPQIAPASGSDFSLTTSNLEIADFNQDGHADLIYAYNETGGGTGVTNTYNQGLAVLTGNGNGAFQATPILTSTYAGNSQPTSQPPQIFSTTDINGDGKPDLLVLNASFTAQTGTVDLLQVYLGNGDGSFQPPATVTTPSPVYGTPVLADVNGDGKLDLALLCETTAGQAQLVTALGHGDGTFGTATIQNIPVGDSIRSGSLAVADFNLDGKPDLALLDYSGDSGVFYGNGDGTFTSVPVAGGIVPKDLLNIFVGGAAVATDLNQDGKPDLLVGSTILLNLYAHVPMVSTLTSTSTAITASPSNSVDLLTAVTFTATITPAAGSASTPSGTMTFLDGETTLGAVAVSSGAATYSTSTLAAGSHTIIAVYSGDANFAGSTSSAFTETVSTMFDAVATTTVITADPTTSVSGATVSFTSQVTPASGTAGAAGVVTFSDGTTPLGMVTLDATGQAVFTTSSLAVGMHSVSAAFAGVAPFSSSTSQSVSVTITAPTPADFAMAVSPASSIVTGGRPATTTLSITPAGGFNQVTNLTCSGAPSGATCTLGSASVTPNGSLASTTTVTLATSTQNAALSEKQRELRMAAGLPFGVIGIAALLGCGFGRRPRRPLMLAVGVAFTGLAIVSGCGGGGNSGSSGSSTSNTSQVYTINLTGTSGSLTHSIAWTVTVQ